jgi:hypothetical protein
LIKRDGVGILTDLTQTPIPRPCSKEWVDEPVCPFAEERFNCGCELKCNHPDRKESERRCPPIYYMRSWAYCDDYRKYMNKKTDKTSD